uniref:Zgc:112980 n=1 Tax=Gasterosteus aculeatus aculeatus TaxID=481459 RepID=A0AAQ4PI03_GASAC
QRHNNVSSLSINISFSDQSVVIVEAEDVKKSDSAVAPVALDEDLVITFSRRAEVLPHARYDCPIHVFTATDEIGAPAAGNQLMCDQCFCYICDKLASLCQMWCCSGLCHCNSHKRSDFWNNLRNSLLLGGLQRFNLTLSELDSHLRHAGTFTRFVSSFLNEADQQEGRAAAVLRLGAAEVFIRHFQVSGLCVRPWDDVLLVSVLKGQNVSGVRKDKGKKDLLIEQIAVVLLRTEVLQQQHRYRELCRYLRVVESDDSKLLQQVRDLIPFFFCMDGSLPGGLHSLFPTVNAPAARLTPDLFLFYLRLFTTATAPPTATARVSGSVQVCISDAGYPDQALLLLSGNLWALGWLWDSLSSSPERLRSFSQELSREAGATAGSLAGRVSVFRAAVSRCHMCWSHTVSPVLCCWSNALRLFLLLLLLLLVVQAVQRLLNSPAKNQL